MASFEITWRRSTRQDLRKLPKEIVSRVVEKVGALANDPKPAGSVKLSNSECAFRIRVGDYRVIYEIWEADQQIEIQRIRHRKDAYRK